MARHIAHAAFQDLHCALMSARWGWASLDPPDALRSPLACGSNDRAEAFSECFLNGLWSRSM